jgi:hypothetical protein
MKVTDRRGQQKASILLSREENRKEVPVEVKLAVSLCYCSIHGMHICASPFYSPNYLWGLAHETRPSQGIDHDLFMCHDSFKAWASGF